MKRIEGLIDILKVAIPLILKALWLSARWAGVARARALQKTAKSGDPTAEIRFLHDRIAELEAALALARIHGKRPGAKPRYTVKERLLVIWYMEYFQAPRRQVMKRLGVAQFTFCRWLKGLEDQPSAGREPANKTSRKSWILCGRSSRRTQSGAAFGFRCSWFF